MEPVEIIEAGGAGGSGSDDDAGDAGKGNAGAGGDNSNKDADGDSNEAPDPVKYPTCGTKAHPVDVVTGRAFTLPIEDLALPGPLPFSFERTYSTSARDEDMGLGWGWAHTLGWHVEVRRRSVLVWNDQGKHIEFEKVPVGSSILGDFGWVLRHDADGYAVDVDDGTWRIFSVQKDERGEYFLLSAIEDRNKNRISLTYDKGHLVEIKDSAGRIIRVKNTKEGRMASLEVKNAETNGQWIAFATYRYDERGDLVQVTDADGYSWHYEYDEQHRLVKDKDRIGLTFHFRYDAQNRCIESWGDYDGKPDPSLADDVPKVLADGITRAKGIHHCKFDYGQGRYTEVADSTRVDRFFGNKRGQLDKAVFGGSVATSKYDANGFQIEKVDEIGAVTHWMRDERGRVLKRIDPLGHATKFERDGYGLMLRVVDAAGGITSATRDQSGNLLLFTDAAGAVTQYSWDERGQLVAVVHASGATTRYGYDGHGNVREVLLPSGAKSTLGYDTFGRRTFLRDPLGAETRYVYSPRGDLVAVYDAVGNVTRYSYDGERHLTQIVSPQGYVSQIMWGGFHRVFAHRDANQHLVRLGYNREGELVIVYNEREEVHRLIHDESGNLVGEETFDGRRFRYRNDPLGRQVRAESNSGEIKEFVYDLAGNVLQRKLSDDAVEAFEYDARGYLVVARGPGGDFRFERDAVGRIVREVQRVDGVDHWVESHYDPMSARVRRLTSLGHSEVVTRGPAGERVQTVLDDGSLVRHGADLLGREVSRRLPRGGWIESEFDSLGRLSGRRAGGVAASRSVTAGEPEWIGARQDGATVDVTYGYTPEGEVAFTSDRTRGSKRYEYDPIGQLLASVPERARAEMFRYDPTGNIEDLSEGAQGRTYARGNRLLRKGATEYRWDDDGRLASKSTPTGSEWTYEWNAAGLLHAVEEPGGQRTEFAYDPFARRVTKRVTRSAPDGTGRVLVANTRFVWDGEVLVHELRSQAAAAGDPVVKSGRTASKTQDLRPSHTGGAWGWRAADGSTTSTIRTERPTS